MINVSLNDLMVGSELPAPRTASRSEAPKFAALLDRGTASREAAPSERPRARSVEMTRDEIQPAKENTTDNNAGADRTTNQTVTEQSTHRLAAEHRGSDTPATDESPTARSETADTGPSDRASKLASCETDSPARTDAADKTAATDSDTTDQSLQAAATDDTAVSLPGAAALSSDIALLVAPGLVPHIFNSLAPASQTPPMPREIAAAQAVSATEPQDSPVLPQLATDAQVQIPTIETPADEAATNGAPLVVPDAPAKTFSETLFAATLLAQADATDNAIVLPASFKPQTAAVARDLTATPSPDQPMASNPSPDRAPIVDQAMKNIPPALHITQPAAPPTPQQTVQISPLLDLQTVGLKIDITQADDSVSGKPVPALANGMVAQISLLQQADKPGAASSPAPAFGIGDSLAAAGNVPTQTATAVVAPPVTQTVADEPRAKAPDQDGMALNAPAPTGTAHANQNTAVDQASPAKFALPTQPATDQVAVHIAKAAAEGTDKINIKLKPVSLGQIEVQLDVASDGRVHAVIAADKPETLDLLQRDARGLERALNDAGLRTDSGSLSFNLRGQNQQFGGMGGNTGSSGGFGSSADRGAPDMDLLGNASRIGAYLNSRAAAGGIDIQV